MEFSIGLRELLIGVVLATLVYLLEVLVFGRRARKSTADPALREEIAALRQSMRQLGERVAALESRLLGESPPADDDASAAVEIRLSAEEPAPSARTPPAMARDRRPPEPVSSPSVHYDRPAQYAREGLPAAEIASRCGLSRAEAELLVALHGPRGPAG